MGGRHRRPAPAAWYITTVARDEPRSYVQIVEFPSYADAMANSEHPATAEFGAGLSKICDDGIAFRDLDVVASQRLSVP